MEEAVQWGALIGGIGFFLVGMILFEETIKQVGKWWLKRVLQKHTKTLTSSIWVWLVQTFIFQSSTIVMMITLGFIGAGMMGMYNALWVILWANIWSTLTPWLVYLLWFKTDLEQYILPLIGVSWLTMMLTSSRHIVHKIARSIVAFCLLFLGLEYMKSSVETLATTIDLSGYAHWWLFGFTLIGFLLTTVMQTSAWVIIIALTAISSWLISLDMGLAIVIGANLWSAFTSTLMGFLSSTRTQSIKKQVAMSHMVFNGFTCGIVILLFTPLKQFVIRLVGTHDLALVLAVFHTVFNLVLLSIWIPLLRPYADKITTWFVDRTATHQFAITQVNTSLSEEILQALHTDMGYLISVVIDYNRAVLWKKWPDSSVHVLELYALIKSGEETILSAMNRYHVAERVDPLVYHTVDTYDELLLNIWASAKYLKDMVDHFESIVESKEDQWVLFYSTLRTMVYDIIDRVEVCMHEKYELDVLEQLYEQITHRLAEHHESFGAIIAEHTNKMTPTALVSELIKTHHYTILSCQSLIDACYRFKKSLYQWTKI
jgi:Na/Pi-cotransporter